MAVDVYVKITLQTYVKIVLRMLVWKLKEKCKSKKDFTPAMFTQLVCLYCSCYL